MGGMKVLPRHSDTIVAVERVLGPVNDHHNVGGAEGISGITA
jgi:hypothetical protein